jgi:hypothetical protein
MKSVILFCTQITSGGYRRTCGAVRPAVTTMVLFQRFKMLSLASLRGPYSLRTSGTSNCPDTAEVTAAYADDLHELETDTDLVVLGVKLQRSAEAAAAWSKRKNLVIAPAKSQVSLFTPDVKQFHAHPQVTIDGQLIPLNKNPKWLGLWWDVQNCWNKSAEFKIKGNWQLHIMRAVENCNWGFDKKTLTLTHNTLIKPTFSHCAPVWAPNVKPTNVKGLQTVQKNYYWLPSGCIGRSPS